MSESGERREERTEAVRDYTDAALVSLAGGPPAGTAKLYTIDQLCFYRLGGISNVCVCVCKDTLVSIRDKKKLIRFKGVGLISHMRAQCVCSTLAVFVLTLCKLKSELFS